MENGGKKHTIVVISSILESGWLEGAKFRARPPPESLLAGGGMLRARSILESGWLEGANFRTRSLLESFLAGWGMLSYSEQ